MRPMMTEKHMKGWPMRKRLLWASLCLLSVTGCASVPPPPVELPDPICPGTREARAKLAATLGDTPDSILSMPWGERVVTETAALIDLVDARCAE